ncbi:MAG: ATPase, T2SS/T4P/T4SS family [Pseudomonadales bacterium]
MFELAYQQEGGRRRSITVKADRCTIGSGRQNDIVLKSRKISRRHAVMFSDDGRIQVEDLGSMSGTWVNRERVINSGPLGTEDEITIGNTRFWLSKMEELETAPVTERLVRSSLASEDIGSKTLTSPSSTRESTQQPLVSEEMSYWGKILHERLISEMDLRRKDVSSMSDQQLRTEAESLLDPILGLLSNDIPESLDTAVLRKNVLDEAVGLGPLEYFLDDEDVTEIMVNNHQEVFIERAGKLTNSGHSFSSDQAVLSVIERIITPIGRRIDESSPMVDARLKDGSRVNAIIPPLALKGPSITIRKFAQKRLVFNDLIKYGSVNQLMVDFLRICVEQRKNIVVSGGTGSGKTTLLNVLSNFIPDTERIITVEDAAELRLHQPNLVSLEARPSNSEGKGAVTIRELVKNTLRMRPDRIVVGECRGGEALDMLQAMNTGHDGSLTTAHANSPRDALARLETMVLMAGLDLPISAIREQVASAVNVIVQQTRFPCGSRKIIKITEVVGIEHNTIQLQDIFVFKQSGRDENGKVQGYFEATGFIPAFYEELGEIGMDVDLSIFRKTGER